MKDYIIYFRYAGDNTQRVEAISEYSAEEAWRKLNKIYVSNVPVLIDIRCLGELKTK